MSSADAEVYAALGRALSRLGVRWYVFGAQAAILYGAARFTEDIDVTVEIGTLEASALVSALVSAGFTPRISDRSKRSVATVRALLNRAARARKPASPDAPLARKLRHTPSGRPESKPLMKLRLSGAEFAGAPRRTPRGQVATLGRGCEEGRRSLVIPFKHRRPPAKASLVARGRMATTMKSLTSPCGKCTRAPSTRGRTGRARGNRWSGPRSRVSWSCSRRRAGPW
jgi:hypothetical protein